MRPLKYLLVIAGITTLIGCGGEEPPQVPTAPAAEQLAKSPNRPDLPFNWFEITKDNWSYGLPTGFDAVIPSSGFGILTQHHSMALQMDVNFAIHPTQMKDIHQYVLADFIMPSIIAGKDIIGTAESCHPMIICAKNPEQTVMAVQTFYKSINIGQERENNGAIYDSSLDFFTLREKTVYHMSCFAEATVLKNNAGICFKAINSLQIK